MQVFKCSVCDVFFEDYGKSTVHLGLKHSQTLVSSIVGNKTTACCRSAVCNGVSSLIVPVKLPNVYVVLRRKTAERFIKARKEAASSSKRLPQKKAIISKTKSSKRNGSLPVEIKLDNMTASEIEGLIGGLAKQPFKNNSKSDSTMNMRRLMRTSASSTPVPVPVNKNISRAVTASKSYRNGASKRAQTVRSSSSNRKSTTEIKLDSLKASEIELLMNDLFNSSKKTSGNKSTLKGKANLPPCEVNSQIDQKETQNEESTNSRKSVRRRKPVVRLVELDDERDDLGDLEQRTGPNSDFEDDEYVPEPEQKSKKRSVVTKRPVRNRSHSSSSDDDQLDSDYELNDEDIPMLDRYDNDPEPLMSNSENADSAEDSDEDMPPILHRFDNSNSQKENNVPKLQPYVRDRRNDKSKPLYKLQCRYCPAQFSAKTWFGNHMREKHANSNGMFSCNICPTGKEYTLRFLHKHYRRYHNLKDVEEQKNWEYTCNICGKKNQTLFAHESHERYHKRFMNPDNPFPCPVCPHRFSTKFNLTQHFNIHLENNPFQCTFPGCGKKFAGNYHLKRHYSYHIYRTIYKCNQCEATYTRPHRLENHVQRLHSTAPADPKSKVRQPVRRRKYAIKSLNMGFGTILDVLNNSSERSSQVASTTDSAVEVKTEHIEDEASEGTPQIQGTFSLDMNSLPRHSNNVVSKDPVFLKLTKDNPELVQKLLPKAYAGSGALFVCDLCGWRGSRAHFLQQHLKKEHNKKLEPVITPSEKNPLGISLICGTCGFQASTSETIAKHMKSSHPELNRVQCSFCTLRFKTDKLKTEHERKCHLSTPKFSCEKCPASFVTEKGFKDHLYLKHTNPSTKFTCKTCGNVYHTKPAYYRHMDQHLPPDKRKMASNQPAKCKLCHQVLATKATLRRHIQYVHLKARNKYNEAVQQRRQQRKAELLQSKSTGLSSEINSSEADNSALAGNLSESSNKRTSNTDTNAQDEMPEENEILGF